MIRTNLSLVAVLAILVAPALGAANESARREKTEPAKEKYYVYGGGCSRSIELRGTYDNLNDAFAAAETFRTKQKMNWVTVRTGAHDKDYFGSSATQYRVYVRRIRCGNWVLHSTVQSADKAKEMADKLKTERSPVEIVGYHAPK
ncbi:MAG TPA: hypothetical protein VKD72_02645 [Gemmataceae bacterium]|nr:hypothetical protein [Gemmataceae bacterium]